MKKTKYLFLVMLMAITAFTTSCLPDTEDKSYLMGYCTIVGTNPNYTLYFDGGGVAKPTTTSISSVCGKNGFESYKRGYLTLHYYDSNTHNDESGELIIEEADFQGGTLIYVNDILDMKTAEERKITSTDSIAKVNAVDKIWAYRGYLNSSINGQFAGTKDSYYIPDVNMVYSPEDISENAITLHCYYNPHMKEGLSVQGSTSFVNSFALSSLINKIPGDGKIKFTVVADGAGSTTIEVERKNLIEPGN